MKKTLAISLRLSLVAAAAFAFTSAAHADTITAAAVPTFPLTPSVDTLSLDSSSQTVSVPGTFTQTGTFSVGDSGSLAQDTPFTFTDSVTVNGITENLVFTGDDNVTTSTDVLTIDALGPINFGDDTLSFAGFTSAPLGVNQSQTVELNATVSAATPEPSSFALLGTGLLGVAGIIRRKLTI
jgi:hypothetical protein